MEKPEIKEHTGEELLLEGKTIDALRQPIVPGTIYRIKICHKRKSLTIMSLEDWEMIECYETGQTIYNQGLVAWANYGCRLGFFDELSDAIPAAEKIIACFNKREDYEKSSQLLKELKKLKRKIKNS